MKRAFIAGILILVCFSPCKSQKGQFSATDFTKKPATNFTQRDYGDAYHTQNWSVAEDSRGIMHFGNFNFVLHFDGVNWDATRTPLQGGFVTSLAADDSGNIFVGAGGEFGHLKPDKKGVLKYISLSDSLEFEDSFFGQIWRTMLYQEGVIFFSQEQIFYWKDGHIEVIYPETSFHLAFVVNDELFARERGKGLMKYENHEFVLLQGGETFKDYGVFGIFPVPENNNYLIVTQEKGLYLYSSGENSKGIKPLKTPHKDILNESRIIGGTSLHNNNIALNTLNRGVIIINPQGYIKNIIDQNSGIRDNDVKQVYQDSRNNLWLVLQTGISRVNYSLPVSFFDTFTGFYGAVNSVAIHNNKLFVGTSHGLFVENDNITGKIYDHFLEIEDFNKDVKNLNSINNLLIIGTRDGLYTLNQLDQIRQISDIDASSVYWSANRELLFIAGENGLFIFDKWLNLIKSYTETFLNNPYNIAENFTDDETTTELWIGTLDLGVARIYINADLSIHHEQYFQGDAGLINTWVQPIQYRNKVYFGVVDGLMEFVEERTDDSTDPSATSESGGYFSFSPLQPVDSASFHHLKYEYERTWLCFDNKVVYFDDEGEMVREPFMSIDFSRINFMLPIGRNTIWLCADDGLARVRIDWEKDYKVRPNINFNRIVSKNDSLLFKGYYDKLEYISPALPYETNEISFFYASQFDENGYKARYSYKLLGHRDEWTDWSYEQRAGFTNLHEGNYVFMVKSLDLYGNESEVLSFEFRVLPPWYRTLGAYALYVLIVILIVYGIVHLSIMRLKAKNIQLEKIIQKRTEEIRAQKEEIEKQHAIVLKQKEEITSSITYASRIQNALAPSEDLLNNSLPEHFILWLPRDIVSGDFYWAKKIDPYVFIVAADCTGHGVPGAFMSMLGIAFLNEIIQQEKLVFSSGDKGELQAAHTLEEMRRYVKNTLQQTGERHEQKDGMDLALCAINNENKTLYFSGANNPLFLIRKNELIEYKPTRNPIGIHIREKEFENHKIKLKKGDVIYIFSDGYRDQFGGVNGKKFGKNAFTELLLSIHQKSLKEQKQILEQTIRDWMSDKHGQLDDILVVGFRID